MLNDFIKSYLKSKCYSGLSLKGPKFKKYDFLGQLKNYKYVQLKKGLNYKKLYSPNASIYISNVKRFLRNKKFFQNLCLDMFMINFNLLMLIIKKISKFQN